MGNFWHCMVCGRRGKLHEHHITKRRHGGRDDPSNIVWLCPKHHRQADMGLIDADFLRSKNKDWRLAEKIFWEGLEDYPARWELEYWESITGGLGTMHDFYDHDDCHCFYPPSVHPRAYPQCMVSLWLSGEISTAELQGKMMRPPFRKEKPDR